MVVKVGINGFGRIGRQVFKTIYGGYEEELQIVAVNDLMDLHTIAHLYKYDSTYGISEEEIEVSERDLIVDGNPVHVFSERDPGNIAWRDYGVDIVIESTGFFTDATKAKAHMNGGAKKVIISAPATNEDITLVLGVNQDKYDPAQHNVISNGSCTTNCIAPTAKVLLENFGIVKGVMVTVHSYTSDQVLLDGPHKDLRRARAAGQNIVPTTTGAARALSLVIPELKGKLDGYSLRVPTPTVSILDLTVETEKQTTVEEVNAAFQQAADGDLEGILGYSDEPLVSMDYKQDDRSAILDSLSTIVVGGNMVKVVAWYDNEWGYACRLADLTNMIAEQGGWQ
ncbi:MAG: type I glyceraldehyde-3-phosphate dehydrogenase [Thermomicrobiales bacterium]